MISRPRWFPCWKVGIDACNLCSELLSGCASKQYDASPAFDRNLVGTRSCSGLKSTAIIKTNNICIQGPEVTRRRPNVALRRASLSWRRLCHVVQTLKGAESGNLLWFGSGKGACDSNERIPVGLCNYTQRVQPKSSSGGMKMVEPTRSFGIRPACRVAKFAKAGAYLVYVITARRYGHWAACKTSLQ